MTDKEVQDIFAEELARKSTEEALMAAYERIAVQILQEWPITSPLTMRRGDYLKTPFIQKAGFTALLV